jgi:hypothetical protein
VLRFADLLTMLNIIKSRREDKHLEAVFYKDFFSVTARWQCTGVSRVPVVVARRIPSHSVIFATIKAPCFWTLSKKRDGLL